MSHKVEIKVQFNDAESLKAAVLEMGGEWLGSGSHKLYDGTYVGLGFKLKGWHYPCVAIKGALQYDDYHGRWGNVSDLSKLKQNYSKNLALRKLRREGFRLVSSKVATNGGIILEVGRG